MRGLFFAQNYLYKFIAAKPITFSNRIFFKLFLFIPPRAIICFFESFDNFLNL